MVLNDCRLLVPSIKVCRTVDSIYFDSMQEERFVFSLNMEVLTLDICLRAARSYVNPTLFYTGHVAKKIKALILFLPLVSFFLLNKRFRIHILLTLVIKPNSTTTCFRGQTTWLEQTVISELNVAKPCSIRLGS